MKNIKVLELYTIKLIIVGIKFKIRGEWYKMSTKNILGPIGLNPTGEYD